MSILFDGSGYITGFAAIYSGEFDITLPTITINSLNKMVFGHDDDADTFLSARTSELRLRFGGATIDLPPVASGAVISDGRITRVGTTVTFTAAGNTGTATSSATMDVRVWGAYNNGSNIFDGEISGVAYLTGAGRQDIIHDFDSGSEGGTLLVNQATDAEGNNDGTLVNFTTGGFQDDAAPSPSVANAGADQSNINAGDAVILDSSASTGVVSRVWTEITTTGVTLSDAAAIKPTFTAPSFTSLTEIIFRLTTVGSDGTDDTDDVSFFVLEDGVVASDPTITITSPYAYQTIESDALGEAIFTLSGGITDLPAGAVAQYQVDDGNWITAATDSNGNFSTDVIITRQKKITVRVSTHTDITDTVSYVTAAPTWLAWWQSNESGRGASTQNSLRNELSDTDPRPTMFKNGVWQRLADPTSEDSSGGSTWVRIAVEFAKLGIPIGVINVAVGGTSIERWLPSSNDLWDTRIMQEFNEANCGGITYTTSLGGESNVGTDSATLRSWLEEMMNALHNQFGSVHYLSYVPRSYENGLGDTLRGEFDYVIENNPYCLFGGDTSVVDLSTSGDGTHLNSSAQVNEAALIRFDAFTAEEVVSNQPPTANAGPNQSVAAGARVILDSSLSSDEDGTIAARGWVQVAGDDVTLDDANAVRPEFIAPSKNEAQRLSFDLVVIDDEGNASDPVTVHIDVAAVEQNNVLNIIDKLNFTLDNDGIVTAYPGRANRETFRFKPSSTENLILDDEGYLDLSKNDIQRVEVSIVERSSVQVISSHTDAIIIDVSRAHCRLGDLDVNSTTKAFDLTFVAYIGSDTKGVVLVAPSQEGNVSVKYYYSTIKTIQ